MSRNDVITKSSAAVPSSVDVNKDDLSRDDIDTIEQRVTSVVDAVSKLQSALQHTVQRARRQRRLSPLATKEVYYEELRRVAFDDQEEIDRSLTRHELKLLWSIASRIKVSDERGIDWGGLVNSVSVVPKGAPNCLCCSCRATLFDQTGICGKCAGIIYVLRTTIITIGERRGKLVCNEDLEYEMRAWEKIPIIYVSRDSLK